MAGAALLCPSCHSPVATGERFCEACGADLGPAAGGRCRRRSGGRSPGPGGAAAPEPEAAAAPCHECGGEVADDGYCTQCGAAAVSPRNHFTEQPAPWVAAVCDRGIRHVRNEDAVAVAAGPEPGDHAVLVVCDGVSSSTDSDVASLAAARAARDALASAPGIRSDDSVGTRVAASTKALVAAANAANDAVIANTAAGPGNPASCTFVAAVLDGAELTVGWVGDSRAYWLPDAADAAAADRRRLLRRGADRGRHAPRRGRERPAGARHHPVARHRRPRPHPAHGVPRPRRPGVAAGLLRRAVELLLRGAGRRRPRGRRGRLGRPEPLALAGALVDWANAQGGQDNITVALARVGARTPGEPITSTQPIAVSSPQPVPSREETQPDGHILS